MVFFSKISPNSFLSSMLLLVVIIVMVVFVVVILVVVVIAIVGVVIVVVFGIVVVVDGVSSIFKLSFVILVLSKQYQHYQPLVAGWHPESWLVFQMLMSFWEAFYQLKITRSKNDILINNVIEEEDGEWIRFLGGNSSSGIEKYRGLNSSDGGNIRDRVKIAGGVIGSGDEIEFSEELKDLLPAEAGK
ncbi:hypothetical protein Tco_1196834 [Tanacetum coccineum]